MTKAIAPVAQTAATSTKYDPKAAFRSVTFSILVNAVAPFALYKILAPHFPTNSIVPLLYASALPIIGLIVGLARTRVIDAIAIFALFGIAYSLVITLLAGEVHLALILGTTQGFIIAAGYLVSALIGKPLLFFIARQFVAGNNPDWRARFTAINAMDGGQTFFLATIYWAGATACWSLVSLGLAFVLPPATYILINNILNTAVNLGLIVVTTAFLRKRLAPLADKFPA